MAATALKQQTETLGKYLLPPFKTNKYLADYYMHDYEAVVFKLWELPGEVCAPLIRDLVCNDLFFLLYYVMGRVDVNSGGEDGKKPFVVQACNEVQRGPRTDTVDLWARGHYKSTIITQAETIQDHCNDKNDTIAIFSHTRPIAKGFMLPIKSAYEDSEILHICFQDVFWSKPRKEAPVWSMDDGLVLKRSSTSNTQSVEAHGLVDGMPTSKHFKKRVYDDVITEKTVGTEGMIHKVDQAIRLSDNLSVTDGSGRQRFVGTIYSHADYYAGLRKQADKGIYKWDVRIKPWFNPKKHKKGFTPPIRELSDRQLDFLSVYLGPKVIRDKHVIQGSYIFACQQELDPSNEEMREFKRSNLKRFNQLPKNRNKYLFIDPANEKKKSSDYTTLALVSVCAQNNRYLEALIRDRLDLGERFKAICKVMRNHPDIMGVWYEKYGKDSDIWYMERQMEIEGIYFNIDSIGGQTSKIDRIRRLSPVIEDKRFYIPTEPIIQHGEDLIEVFLDNEFDPFPFCVHDDMLDAISRIEDPEVNAAAPVEVESDKEFKRERDESAAYNDAFN